MSAHYLIFISPGSLFYKKEPFGFYISLSALLFLKLKIQRKRSNNVDKNWDLLIHHFDNLALTRAFTDVLSIPQSQL